MKEALRLNTEIQKSLEDEISKAKAILEKNSDKQVNIHILILYYDCKHCMDFDQIPGT